MCVGLWTPSLFVRDYGRGLATRRGRESHPPGILRRFPGYVLFHCIAWAFYIVCPDAKDVEVLVQPIV